MKTVKPATPSDSSNPIRRSDDRLMILGVGAATSLGDSVSACAAARAGVTRSCPLEAFLVLDPDSGEMVPVTGHPVSFLTQGFSGVARLTRLGSLALRELLVRGVLDPRELPETAVILAVGSGYYLNAIDASVDAEEGAPAFGASPPPESEVVDKRRAAIETKLIRCMFERAGLPPPAHHALVYEDHAGGALALLQALELLSAGVVRRCVVGGIDSYCELEVLDALQGLDLLKTPDNPAGIAPGEAAVFIVVEGAGARLPSSAAPTIECIAYTSDGKHLFAPDNPGCRSLAEVLTVTGPPGRGEAAAWTIGSHNGTFSSAAEWGRTLTMVTHLLRQGVHWYPAASFGDTGAAACFLASCLSVRAFERGYASARSALVWASSPNGSKSSFTVQG
jgi:3-oxoacyl-[acyl-carrier-protein] synthase-1